MLGYLGAALGIGSDLLNRQFRRKEEKGRRKYERTQELDRRSYDQAMWDKVNKYNHPLAQMQRLTEAGLNPNLIYGSSPGSAVGNAQSISAGKQLQAEAPQYQMGNPMTPFMDTTVKQAQSNNLKSQSDLNDMNALKAIEETKLTGVKRKLAEGTIFSNIEARRYEADIVKEKYLQEKLRTKLMSDKEVGIIAEKIIQLDKLKAQGAQEGYKARVEALNAFLAEKGIRSNDPFWARVMSLVTGMDLPTTDREQKEFRKEFELWLNNQNGRL